MKHVITTTLLLATNMAIAQQPGILENSSTWMRNKIETAKKSLEPKPIDPYALIAGAWKDKVQLTSKSAKPPTVKDPFAYSWIGAIEGRIDQQGSMYFTLGNGCRFTGSAQPFASDTMWSIEGRFEFCPMTTLNRVLTGRVSSKKNRIYIWLTTPAMTSDPQLNIELRTTLLNRI